MQPVAISLAFFFAIVALRSLDLLVLRVDAWPDPTIVSKALGLLLVVWYVRSLRYHVSSLGLHTRNAAYAVCVGGLTLLAIFASLYAIEFQLLRGDGETPRVVLGIVDQQTGVIVAGTAFLSVYFAGQVLNAFTEECIFRGILLPQFMRRMPFWKANLAQASLFAVAHLVWPMSSWALGRATLSEALSEAGMLLVFTAVGGLIFGYLYYRTNNLWTPLLAHLIDNSVWLFVHIETSTRLNAESDVAIFGRAGFLSLVLVAWIVAKASRIPPLQPWGNKST